MADYWKSQAKKFCDFCKCWIADNKPSVQFHESGKKHKENVAKRLGEISKNSAKSYKESLQLDQDMKKMEEEAFKAYMKDLQENPDYTSKRIIEESEKKKKELEELTKQDKTSEPTTEASSTTCNVPQASSSKVWYEAKSEEGHTYYWHVDTGESKWEVPEEGFLSIEEQTKQKSEKASKKDKPKKRDRNEQSKSGEKEGFRKKKKKQTEDKPIAAIGPEPKPEPLGQWIAVEPVIQEELDLQLPQQNYVAINIPQFTEPEIKFKEKTVKSLEIESDKYHGFVKKEAEQSTETFKKRAVKKGNLRQKLDTD